MAELRRQFTYKTGWTSARLHVADRVVSVLKNVFGLWCGESQAAPVRTHLPLRPVR
jgi:hypothetical protein